MASPDAQEVWLARPGELIVSQVEELATRIGGRPLYPAGCPEVAPQLTACLACGSQLALILQAYAPLTFEQTGSTAQKQRLLYVFGCTAEGCGKQPSCWRALRLTLPSAPASTEQQQQQQQQQPAQPAPQPAANDWGTAEGDDWGVGGADDWGMSGGDDWGAAAGGEPTSGAGAANAFDFGDLNAALEAVGSTAPAGKAASKQQQQAETPSGSAAAAGAAPAYDPVQPSLPAFYLYAEPESRCSASSGRQQRSEQEHLQQLMARYEAEAAAAGEASAAAMATAAGTACAPSVEGGPESWAGEGYEEDAVLAPTGGTRAGVGAPFFKFAKQLGRCPDQCARYSFSGTPLWPTRGQPAPAPCNACGRPRVFELQLMTPLIPALTEAAEWLAAEQGGPAAAASLQPPDSWEWLTVAVFSCSGSCCSSGSEAALVEEQVILVNEE